MPAIGSRWVAVWAAMRPDAFVWTVRGVTEHGIYITSPQSRSPGHLVSHRDFQNDYVAH
jgi:hypothetical protein